MSRFKNLWSSFWGRDHGFGIIEAAVTLPLFLLTTFGAIEFGNMFLNSYKVQDVSKTVTNYLQANPNATKTDLANFVANLSLGLKNIQGQEAIINKIKIQSSKVMFTTAQFDALCNGQNKDWTNPWLEDGDPTNDKNPYYIQVCYPYTYKAITPLPGLTKNAVPATKTLKGKNLAYVDLKVIINGAECPSGQFVVGYDKGDSNKPICKKVDAGCPNGQYMYGLSGTMALCKQLPSPTVDVSQRVKSKTSDCRQDPGSPTKNMVVVGIDVKGGMDVYCAPLKLN